MMKLQMRAEQLARAEQRRRIAKLARGYREQMPGASIVAEAAALVIEGRGVLRRWLTNPSIRFIGDFRQ